MPKWRKIPKIQSKMYPKYAERMYRTAETVSKCNLCNNWQHHLRYVQPVHLRPTLEIWIQPIQTSRYIVSRYRFRYFCQKYSQFRPTQLSNSKYRKIPRQHWKKHSNVSCIFLEMYFDVFLCFSPENSRSQNKSCGSSYTWRIRTRIKVSNFCPDVFMIVLYYGYTYYSNG